MAPRPIADAAMPLTPAKEAAKPTAPAALRLVEPETPELERITLERITLDDLDDEEREQLARDGEWVPPKHQH